MKTTAQGRFVSNQLSAALKYMQSRVCEMTIENVASKASQVPLVSVHRLRAYELIFEWLRQDSQDELLDGKVVMRWLTCSKLDDDVLAKIWSYSDTNCRGRLCFIEFILALHLAIYCKTNSSQLNHHVDVIEIFPKKFLPESITKKEKRLLELKGEKKRLNQEKNKLSNKSDIESLTRKLSRIKKVKKLIKSEIAYNEIYKKGIYDVASLFDRGFAQRNVADVKDFVQLSKTEATKQFCEPENIFNGENIVNYSKTLVIKDEKDRNKSRKKSNQIKLTTRLSKLSDEIERLRVETSSDFEELNKEFEQVKASVSQVPCANTVSEEVIKPAQVTLEKSAIDVQDVFGHQSTESQRAERHKNLSPSFQLDAKSTSLPRFIDSSLLSKQSEAWPNQGKKRSDNRKHSLRRRPKSFAGDKDLAGDFSKIFKRLSTSNTNLSSDRNVSSILDEITKEQTKSPNLFHGKQRSFLSRSASSLFFDHKDQKEKFALKEESIPRVASRKGGSLRRKTSSIKREKPQGTSVGTLLRDISFNSKDKTRPVKQEQGQNVSEILKSISKTETEMSSSQNKNVKSILQKVSVNSKASNDNAKVYKTYFFTGSPNDNEKKGEPTNQHYIHNLNNQIYQKINRKHEVSENRKNMFLNDSETTTDSEEDTRSRHGRRRNRNSMKGLTNREDPSQVSFQEESVWLDGLVGESLQTGENFPKEPAPQDFKLYGSPLQAGPAVEKIPPPVEKFDYLYKRSNSMDVVEDNIEINERKVWLSQQIEQSHSESDESHSQGKPWNPKQSSLGIRLSYKSEKTEEKRNNYEFLSDECGDSDYHCKEPVSSPATEEHIDDHIILSTMPSVKNARQMFQVQKERKENDIVVKKQNITLKKQISESREQYPRNSENSKQLFQLEKEKQSIENPKYEEEIAFDEVDDQYCEPPEQNTDPVSPEPLNDHEVLKNMPSVKNTRQLFQMGKEKKLIENLKYEEEIAFDEVDDQYCEPSEKHTEPVSPEPLNDYEVLKRMPSVKNTRQLFQMGKEKKSIENPKYEEEIVADEVKDRYYESAEQNTEPVLQEPLNEYEVLKRMPSVKNTKQLFQMENEKKLIENLKCEEEIAFDEVDDQYFESPEQNTDPVSQEPLNDHEVLKNMPSVKNTRQLFQMEKEKKSIENLKYEEEIAFDEVDDQYCEPSEKYTEPVSQEPLDDYELLKRMPSVKNTRQLFQMGKEKKSIENPKYEEEIAFDKVDDLYCKPPEQNTDPVLQKPLNDHEVLKNMPSVKNTRQLFQMEKEKKSIENPKYEEEIAFDEVDDQYCEPPEQNTDPVSPEPLNDHEVLKNMPSVKNTRQLFQMGKEKKLIENPKYEEEIVADEVKDQYYESAELNTEPVPQEPLNEYEVLKRMPSVKNTRQLFQMEKEKKSIENPKCEEEIAFDEVDDQYCEPPEQITDPDLQKPLNDHEVLKRMPSVKNTRQLFQMEKEKKSIENPKCEEEIVFDEVDDQYCEPPEQITDPDLQKPLNDHEVLKNMPSIKNTRLLFQAGESCKINKEIKSALINDSKNVVHGKPETESISEEECEISTQSVDIQNDNESPSDFSCNDNSCSSHQSTNEPLNDEEVLKNMPSVKSARMLFQIEENRNEKVVRNGLGAATTDCIRKKKQKSVPRPKSYAGGKIDQLNISNNEINFKHEEMGKTNANVRLSLMASDMENLKFESMLRESPEEDGSLNGNAYSAYSGQNKRILEEIAEDERREMELKKHVQSRYHNDNSIPSHETLNLPSGISV